jgi:hypothetical protein
MSADEARDLKRVADLKKASATLGVAEVHMDLAKALDDLAAGLSDDPPALFVAGAGRRGRRRLVNRLLDQDLLPVRGQPPAAGRRRSSSSAKALSGVPIELAPHPEAGGGSFIERSLSQLVRASATLFVLSASQLLSAQEQALVRSALPYTHGHVLFVVTGRGDLDDPADERDVLQRMARFTQRLDRTDAEVFLVDLDTDPDVEAVRDALSAWADDVREQHPALWRRRADRWIATARALQSGATVRVHDRGQPAKVSAGEAGKGRDVGGVRAEGREPNGVRRIEHAPGPVRECLLCGAWSDGESCPECEHDYSAVYQPPLPAGLPVVRCLVDLLLLADDRVELGEVLAPRLSYINDVGLVDGRVRSLLAGAAGRAIPPLATLLASVQRAAHGALLENPGLSQAPFLQAIVSIRLTVDDPTLEPNSLLRSANGLAAAIRSTAGVEGRGHDRD